MFLLDWKTINSIDDHPLCRWDSAHISCRACYPGAWDVNETGDFVSAGTKLIVRPLVGSMDGPAVSSHWCRFGVEEVAYRIDIRPEMIDPGARCATLFVWDASFEFPNGTALQSLFDQLNTAIPVVANID